MTSFLASVTYATGAVKAHAAPVCKVQTSEGIERPTKSGSRCGSRLHEWRLG